MNQNNNLIESKIDNFFEEFNAELNAFRKENGYGSDKTDEYVQYEFDMHLLQQGKIPQEFARQMGVFDNAEWPAYEVVRKVFDDIISAPQNKQYFHEDIYGNLKDTRIFITSDPNFNACVLKDTKPPIICVNKGLLVNEKGEPISLDRLACVLAHELSHPTFSEMTQMGSSSFQQEYSSDVLGCILANNAGYAPTAARDIWEEFSKNEKKQDIYRRYLLAAHPPSKDRAQVIQDAIGLIGMNNTPIIQPSTKTIPTEYIEPLQNLKKPFFMDELFEKIGYDQASDEEKVRAMLHISKYFMAERPNYLQKFKNYEGRNTYRKKWDALTEEQQGTIVTLLMNEKCEANKENASSFTYLSPLIEEIERRKYFIHLKFYDSKAENKDEEILQHARGIDAYKKAYLQGQSQNHMANVLVPQLRFSDQKRFIEERIKYGLSLNNGNTFDLPYTPLEECAKRAKGEDKRIIQSIIDELDFNDLRQEYEQKYEIVNGKIIGLKKDHFRTKLDLLDSWELFDVSNEIEKEWQINHQKKQEIIFKTIDWSLMDTDYDLFIQRYESALTPTYTFSRFLSPLNTEHGIKFDDCIAKKFTEKLEILYQQNPQIYGKKINEFYTTVFPNMLKKYKESEGWNHVKWPELKISYKNPYVQFLKTPAGKEVDFCTKMSLLANTDITEGSTFKVNEDDMNCMFNDSIQELTDFNFPNTRQELEELINLKPNSNYEDVDFVRIRTIFSRYASWHLATHDHQTPFFSKDTSWCSAEIYYGESITPEVNRITEDIAKKDIEYYLNDYTTDKPQNMLYTLLDVYDRFYTHNTHYYEVGKLDVTLSDAFENKIMATMDELKDSPNELSVVEQAARKLLKNPSPVDNPKFHEYLMDTVVSYETERLGKEKLSEDFYQRLNPERFFYGFSPLDGSEILSRILTKCEAQTATTSKVQDLIDHKLGADRSVGLKGAVLGLEKLNESDDLNEDILKFLITPLNYESTAQMLKMLKLKSGGKKNQAIIRDENNIQFSKNLIKQLDPELAGRIDNQDVLPPPDSYFEYKLAMFHRQYWSADETQKMATLKKIIFKDGQKPQEDELKVALKLVTDKLFPKDEQYSDIANLIVETYYAQYPLEAKPYFISMLYSIEPPEKISYDEKYIPSQKQKLKNPGPFIAKVLKQMGPAGAKLAQALHSNPSTSEEIKQALDGFKSNNKIPSRSEIFSDLERIYKNDPNGKELEASIAHVGKVLGGGSFCYTILVENHQGEESALTIVRNNVEKDANFVYDKFFTPVATVLTEKDAKTFGSLPTIVQQARYLTSIEADALMGGEQTKIAQEQYKNISVQCDKQQFTIQAAPLLSCGEQFKQTALAQGKHFNDLPQNTPEEKEFKKAAAKAIFSTELYILLQCGPIDSDRHGAQVRVNGNNITMFDHGAIDFTKEKIGVDENGKNIYKREPLIPTESDKKCLGKILGETLTEASHGTPFEDALLSKLGHPEKYPENSHFISTVLRALLATEDYRKALGDTPDEKSKNLQDCLSAVMEQKLGLDMTLLTAIEENMDDSTLESMMNTKTTFKKGMILKDKKLSFRRRMKAAFNYYTQSSKNTTLHKIAKQLTRNKQKKQKVSSLKSVLHKFADNTKEMPIVSTKDSPKLQQAPIQTNSTLIPMGKEFKKSLQQLKIKHNLLTKFGISQTPQNKDNQIKNKTTISR